MYAASIGRDGRGALIVMASGNGAVQGDSCAFDGYAGSVYTFTIGEKLFPVHLSRLDREIVSSG